MVIGYVLYWQLGGALFSASAMLLEMLVGGAIGAAVGAVVRQPAAPARGGAARRRKYDKSPARNEIILQ